MPESTLDLPTPNGSALCLECGLCCNGVLHSHGILRAEEIPLARDLGMRLGNFKSNLGFHQPCHLYQNNCCSIYAAKRPGCCGTYQCQLLKKHLAGEISLDESKRIVHTAKELAVAVQEIMPTDQTLPELAQKMEDEWDTGQGPFGSPEAREQQDDLFHRLVRLRIYLRKHFDKRQPGQNS
jgi:hypothetical protein